MSKRAIRWMDNVFYPGVQDRWDDKRFREMILSEMRPSSCVLDIGAGRGGKDEMDFKSCCKFIAGVDPDKAVLDNRKLHEAKVSTPPQFAIPYEDSSFEIVISNSVIEHVADADYFFSEVGRVLKPGGVFFAKTPNRYHYVALIAGVTPHWFHQYYNKLRGREVRDTFPTTYACNKKHDLMRIARQNGFAVEKFERLESRP